MPLAPAASLVLDDAVEHAAGARIVVVIGSDELAQAAAVRFPSAEIRLFNDVVSPFAESASFTRFNLDTTVFDGADLVLGELPKSLAELDEIASLAASAAVPFMTLAGREKHLNRGMNQTLERWFDSVTASRGRQKSRALRAARPRTVTTLPYPLRAKQDELGFEIVAHGGAFAGTKLDIGTRALLDAWPLILTEHSGRLKNVVDLGCGTGVLATFAARNLPSISVTATDRSWAAVNSARLTAASAGVVIDVTHEESGRSVPDGTVDLILFNPPFHEGTAVSNDMSHAMFAQAARMLRPQGSLAVVYNSHLQHRSALRRIVGPTAQLHRTPKFTVTLSKKELASRPPRPEEPVR